VIAKDRGEKKWLVKFDSGIEKEFSQPELSTSALVPPIAPQAPLLSVVAPPIAP
jgi:hypothetical protein